MAGEVNTAALTNQYRRHYSDQLLATAENTVVLNQFARQAIIEKKLGATTARYFRRVAADSSNVVNLVEGVAPTQKTTISYTPVDVDLVQIGQWSEFSDVATWSSLLNILDDSIELFGETAALKADDVTLSVLAHASTGATKRYAQANADWAALAGAADAAGKFVATDGLHAATALKIAKAPKIGGYYIGIVGPQVSDDLRQDQRWLDAAKYSNVKALYRGEIGELDGIRYVETTNTWGEDASGAEGTRVASGEEIYVSIFTGREGYGVTNFASQGPTKPEVIIVNTADKTDPLNQKLTAGWKAFYNSLVLNKDWVVALRSRATY